MLILVFSDSHGSTEAMLSVTAARRPDLLIHLGDCLTDALAIVRAFPALPALRLPGNCDFAPDPAVQLYTAGPHTLYLTHGHRHGVKRDTARLAADARAAGARAALFGHTHTPHNQDAGGLLLFNPGSIARPRVGPPTYGLIEIVGNRLEALVVPL
ncbi:MAG: YfcE family phosphodiesterase [Oscillospiraceae bacterium]|jgi:putative phosphoesterase|nr:YfcE family phosphodiesterase [Oscillospiraceae bacterium]